MIELQSTHALLVSPKDPISSKEQLLTQADPSLFKYVEVLQELHIVLLRHDKQFLIALEHAMQV